MHSCTSSLFHCIFATKNRAPLLTADLRERLWPYLGGIARENGMKALAVGGVADHGIHETFPRLANFAWQQGYGAFSIGVWGIEETCAYIRKQEAHHRTRTFREEVIAVLQRHGFGEEAALLR